MHGDFKVRIELNFFTDYENEKLYFHLILYKIISTMLSSEGVFPALMGIYNYIQCFMNLKGPLFVYTNIFYSWHFIPLASISFWF